jgi:hypothetical protein
MAGKTTQRVTRATTKRATKPAAKTTRQRAAPKSARSKRVGAARGTSTRSRRAAVAKPKLLSGDNPQIAKGDGDAPVARYIAAIPGWKREVARRLDSIIVRTVPGVRKAIKWNSPFYGMPGQGWFLDFHCFAKYVKVAFFRGTSLRPVPPGPSKNEEVRYLDIHENDRFDETQFASWVKQAAHLPGWAP